MRGLFERVKTPPAKNPRPSRSKRKTPEQPPIDLRVNLAPPEASRNPVSANHFEPLPVQDSTPFDHFHFAWPTEEVDMSASGDSSALGLHAGLHASEFFYAPLPFDNDLVESMSYLSDMHDTALPGTYMYTYLISSNGINVVLFSGFAWMKQMPPMDFGQYQQQTTSVYNS